MLFRELALLSLNSVPTWIRPPGTIAIAADTLPEILSSPYAQSPGESGDHPVRGHQRFILMPCHERVDLGNLTAAAFTHGELPTRNRQRISEN